MNYRLDVWRSSDARTWEQGAEEHRSAVETSDADIETFETRAAADARLDELEKLPRVVEVRLYAGERTLATYGRNAAGELVAASRAL